MGYLHIDNLYKYPDIFMFKEVYCLEKIHGTSAHVAWKDGKLHFFAGGVKHDQFKDIFNPVALAYNFANVVGQPEVTVFGEAYGGKCQKMSDVYGKDLRFVVFDVKVGEWWLDVPNAHDVATKLGLDFVDYNLAPCDLESLTAERDRPSWQAIRNGIIDEPQKREGIVIRPKIELRKNNGDRIICKYKTEKFRETKTPREVNPDKLKVLQEAKAIAGEWVTPMRLEHVLQKLPEATDMKHTGEVIRAMQEDVERESAGEVEWSKEAKRAVGTLAAQLYKAKVTKVAQ